MDYDRSNTVIFAGDFDIKISEKDMQRVVVYCL